MTYTNTQYVKPDKSIIRVDINGVTSFVPLDPVNTSKVIG